MKSAILRDDFARTGPIRERQSRWVKLSGDNSLATPAWKPGATSVMRGQLSGHGPCKGGVTYDDG